MSCVGGSGPQCDRSGRRLNSSIPFRFYPLPLVRLKKCQQRNQLPLAHTHTPPHEKHRPTASDALRHPWILSGLSYPDEELCYPPDEANAVPQGEDAEDDEDDDELVGYDECGRESDDVGGGGRMEQG